MPFAQISGQRLHFHDSGGDGPPIVFSHGFAGDHTWFEPQALALADVYRVLTWDARGSGSSEPAAGPASYWDLARDVFGLLDVLGIERAVLAGTEQGGELSLRATLLHPDRVRALVLLDPLTTDRADDGAVSDGEDVTDRLDEIAPPVLVVHGAGNPTLPSPRAREVAAHVADCRGVVAVDGATDAPHRTHPDVVTAAIRAFLEGLPA